jgi:hypothetical protein
VLKECPNKDFSAVIAELSIDTLPYKLCTNHVGVKHDHIANHRLHAEEERKVFFSESSSAASK